MQQETNDLRLVAAIIATGLMSLSGVVSETAMNVTFPSLMTAFGISTSTVQWLTTGYLLALALVVPLSSYLKQRFSLRGLFLTANLLFFAATVLCSLAPHFAVLLVGRLMQGAAAGIALPLMKAEFAAKNPQIMAALNRLAGKISEAEMSEMNYRVKVQGESAEHVARDYLEKNGLLGK